MPLCFRPYPFDGFIVQGARLIPPLPPLRVVFILSMDRFFFVQNNEEGYFVVKVDALPPPVFWEAELYLRMRLSTQPDRTKKKIPTTMRPPPESMAKLSGLKHKSGGGVGGDGGCGILGGVADGSGEQVAGGAIAGAKTADVAAAAAGSSSAATATAAGAANGSGATGGFRTNGNSERVADFLGGGGGSGGGAGAFHGAVVGLLEDPTDTSLRERTGAAAGGASMVGKRQRLAGNGF